MSNNIELTKYSRFSGCGAKLGPSLLDKALCGLEQPAWPNLIADFHGSEDAGVYKLNDSMALVQTIDFFPPIADDPFTFGKIAAANAISDIYAMGATPITAVSVVCYPEDSLDMQWLRQIMDGGLANLINAEVALLGGHSIKDKELKFGFCVNGIISPEKALRNNTPRVGDSLVLTKALGTGCINRALKAGAASERAVKAAEESMCLLNRKAAELLKNKDVSSCTDVTGFGLCGHVAEMLAGGTCDFIINTQDIPLLPEVKNYIKDGYVPGGTHTNKEFRISVIKDSDTLSDEMLNLVFDPQTSGGLLVTLPQEDARTLVAELGEKNIPAGIIGQVVNGTGSIILS